MTEAKIFFYKLEYLIFMNFLREYIYMISMYVQIFRRKQIYFGL
jgi:hypothetical protein